MKRSLFRLVRQVVQIAANWNWINRNKEHQVSELRSDWTNHSISSPNSAHGLYFLLAALIFQPDWQKMFTFKFLPVLFLTVCIASGSESEYCNAIDEYDENSEKCSTPHHFTRKRFVGNYYLWKNFREEFRTYLINNILLHVVIIFCVT